MSSSVVKIFISYAWESDNLKKSVAELAAWIVKTGEKKIEVTTDHLYSNRPPKEGWPIWMYNQIEQSDVVLIVCTPSYITRFNKILFDGESGRGVTYEGAIITQELYNAFLVNNKFFPILPDDGNVNNIPKILMPFFNGHKFPSGNIGILKLILNENPTYDDLIKDFFQTDSVPEDVKESFAELFNEQIVNEIEKEIVLDIMNPHSETTKNMLSPIHTTVRAFLNLNEIDKISIAKRLGVFDDSFVNLNIIERDKEIFKLVKSRDLLAVLWNEINSIKPFENLTNPFFASTHEYFKQ